MIKTKKKQTKTDKIKSAYCSLFCNSLINFNNCIKFITAGKTLKNLIIYH